MGEFRLIIGSERRATANHVDICNPSDGSVVGAAPLCTQSDLDAAVDAATRAFPAWASWPDADRKAACHAVAAKIEENSEELALLLTQEQGKPLNGLGSRFELGGAVAWARHTADLDLPVKILQDDNTGKIELYRKPIGVVGSITPWNWPLMIAIWHILPAIRVGNTVINKPAPQTPLSTLRMIELMAEVLPPGVVNCVSGDDALGKAISQHAGIHKIVFTGSCETGKKVMASAANTLKRLTLELGGNDAGIVLPDCDPKAIAEGLFWGAFINNGQTCAALKWLYVHQDILDAVCRELVAFAKTVPMGDGRDAGNLLGPVQNRVQYDHVAGLVSDAKARGAKILLGGDPQPGSGLFYPLTIVTGVSNGCRLVDEEQFGPALPVIAFSDIDEVLTMANDNPNGLGGSVWSGDVNRAKAIAIRMECGSVWINKHGAIQPNAPFGGVKASGVGIEFGEEGLLENTTAQVVFS